MKLNPKKIATSYCAKIDGDFYRFGWYDSGRAFIAKDDEIMTYEEAYRKFVPKLAYTICNSFYNGQTRYDLNTGGIVRYLRDRYCK